MININKVIGNRSTFFSGWSDVVYTKRDILLSPKCMSLAQSKNKRRLQNLRIFMFIMKKINCVIWWGQSHTRLTPTCPSHVLLCTVTHTHVLPSHVHPVYCWGQSHTHILPPHVHHVYCCAQSHTYMSYPHMSILCTVGDSHIHMSYPYMSIL
jgi:hypothetical protein